MSEHDIMVLKMLAGVLIGGISLVFCAYGVGLIARNWGWWN